jgi:drug/metabolite transporter (DMT)-like permease
MKTLILVLISVFLGVLGQVLLKKGVMTTGPIDEFNLGLIKIIFKPLVLLGLLSYASSAVFWLVVLSRAELSYAYPMVALGYVFVFFFSWWYFNDKVTPVRIIGLVFIVIGVVLVALSRNPSPGG